jgi:hypothetical protein
VRAAKNYFELHPHSTLERVCFLAWTDADEELCLTAFLRLGLNFDFSEPGAAASPLTASENAQTLPATPLNERKVNTSLPAMPPGSGNAKSTKQKKPKRPLPVQSPNETAGKDGDEGIGRVDTTRQQASVHSLKPGAQRR